MSTEERDAAELSQIRPFKAKPVNEKVLKGTVPVSKPSRFDLTVPMSPAITKPKALAPRLPSPERIIKANPVPDLKPFEPKVKHRVIEVQEFELPGDAVRQKKLQELEEKRRLENEEITAKRQFKAQPLPETIDHPSVRILSYQRRT